MHGATPTARTWRRGWTRCGGAAGLLLLGLVVGGCANASAVMDFVARVLASPRVAGWRRASSRLEISSTRRDLPAGGNEKRSHGASGARHSRRLAGVAIACGTLAVAACGSTTSSSTVQLPPTAPVPVSAGTQLTPLAQTPGSVPTEYLSQYTSVEADAQAFEGMAGGSSSGGTTTVGAELLAANGNIGTGLLAAHALSGVETELDAYQALGVQGVTVCVSFPLLLPSTPNSSSYLSFYAQVAQQVQARGMVLSVEENPIFAGTPLTTLPISYAGLTLDSYAAEQQQQAQLIIDDMKPAYLSLLTEPDTFSSVLHLDLDSPATASQVVTEELSGLKRSTTLVGAGSGTWSSPFIDQALLTTSIDYLDVHVYPLAPADLTNLTSDVAAARAAHRPLVMDETWLYKDLTDGNFGPAGTSQANASGPENEMKDVSFSFWEPLDESYVAAMVSYVRSQGFSYVAFFDGARCFFGYLTWSSELDAASYPTFSQEYNQMVSANFAGPAVSGTGLRLQQAIAGR
jgi:hypothetical protein